MIIWLKALEKEYGYGACVETVLSFQILNDLREIPLVYLLSPFYLFLSQDFLPPIFYNKDGMDRGDSTTKVGTQESSSHLGSRLTRVKLTFPIPSAEFPTFFLFLWWSWQVVW